MSSDSWENMRRAKEDEYFERENKKAIERLSKRAGDKPRLSPITGQPMEQSTFMGVVIDRCKKSGGVWLDKGELELIIQNYTEKKADKEDWISDFFKGLTGK